MFCAYIALLYDCARERNSQRAEIEIRLGHINTRRIAHELNPAFSGVKKKKKIKKSEAARFTPHRASECRFVLPRFPPVKLATLSRIIVLRPQDRDEDAAAAPARQMRGVVVLPLYFGRPFTSIFIVVLELTIRYRRECACKALSLSPTPSRFALENEICWRWKAYNRKLVTISYFFRASCSTRFLFIFLRQFWFINVPIFGSFFPSMYPSMQKSI